jgi:hypothetical protein
MPVRSSAAMSLWSLPAAASSTILDRRTSRAAVVRPRDHRSRVRRSSSETRTAGAIRRGWSSLSTLGRPRCLISSQTKEASH